MKFKRVIIYLFLMFSLAACDKFAATNLLDKALTSGEPLFSIRYTRPFAQRFTLPENKAVTLSENLQAIAVEINKINNRYTCELHLYVEDNLDIYKPGSGDYFFDAIMSEVFFIDEISDEDYAWNVKNILVNKMRARFDSTLQANYTFTSTLSYNRLHSSFLPGLTLVTLNTECYMFERDRYPANIWIQKQNVGDYLVGNDGPGGVKQTDKNHRFPIPIDLIDEIQPYIKIAEKHNYEQM